jgi:hypothetical protein
MGMYDSVKVLYKLPMPENPLGYVASEGFQTKDLDNTLSLYQINEKGELYLQKSNTRWVEGNPKSSSIMGRLGYAEVLQSWLERCWHHGEICIYDFKHTEGDYDYWIEYKITYSKGEFSDVELLKFEATPNGNRKKSDEEFHKRLQACAEFRKSKKYRYFFKHTNYCVRAVFGAFRKVIIFASSNVHKLEDFLTV